MEENFAPSFSGLPASASPRAPPPVCVPEQYAPIRGERRFEGSLRRINNVFIGGAEKCSGFRQVYFGVVTPTDRNLIRKSRLRSVGKMKVSSKISPAPRS